MSTTDEQAYLSVRPLIRSLVWKHRRRHGGCIEELEAEANYHFAKALRTYSPRRGRLTTWVHWKVRCGLLDWARRQRAMDRDREQVPADVWERCVARRSRELLGELSGDAVGVEGLLLALDGSEPEERLSAAAELLQEAGWAVGRILEAYSELWEALT